MILVDQSLSAIRDMDGEEVSSLLERYKLPSNVNNLITPDLNSEFLRLTSLHASDKRIAFVQKLIEHSLRAALSLCQELHDTGKANFGLATKQIYFKSFEVVTLLNTSFPQCNLRETKLCAKFSGS